MEKGQPEVMQLTSDNLLSDKLTVGDLLDLRWVQREEIVKIEDRKFVSMTKTGSFHGVALWFDVVFDPIVFEAQSLNRKRCHDFKCLHCRAQGP